MARRRKKEWSKVIEESGVEVRIYERPESDAVWYSVVEAGRKVRRSLQTTDRTVAENRAKDIAKALAEARLIGIRPDALMLGQLFTTYNDHALLLLNAARQKWVKSRQAMFLEAWGRNLVVRRLTQKDVEHYCEQRRTGVLTPFKPIEGKRKNRRGRKPVAVRDGTLAGDFRWLSSAFNFAREHEHNDVVLLTRNPLRRLRLPREKNPRRPVASHHRYLATLTRVDGVDPDGRLRCILALARFTGRRIDAICNLHASDLLLSPDRMRTALAEMGRDERLADLWPLGAIRWRAEHDKLGFDELAPLSAPARDALDAYLRSAGRVGNVVLFPAPGPKVSEKRAEAEGENRKERKEQAIERRLVTRWLLKAEKAAGLPKLEQGCWHAYRRLWVVERKHLPDTDVASAGGWRDTRALKVSYQQADPATMLRVVQHGA